MENRIKWIDTARGLSMLAILLLHTEVYYAGYDVINYGFYVEDVLMVFFFISGYLFYRDGGFDISRKLVSIARGIIMPYFIFTAAMALPRAVAHNNFTSVTELILNVVSGRASWFVTALAVSEVLFSTILHLSERYGIRWIVPLSCLLSLLAAIFLKHDALLVWNTDIALMAMVYLYAGYLCHKHKDAIKRHVNATTCILLLIGLVILKWFEYKNDLSMLVYPLYITSFPVFLADTAMAIAFIIGISRRIPSCRLITFIGRNSIVYYFICGGIPLITSAILRKAGMEYGGNYLTIIAAFVIVCAAATAVTWIIMRYIPFVTGRKTHSSSHSNQPGHITPEKNRQRNT